MFFEWSRTFINSNFNQIYVPIYEELSVHRVFTSQVLHFQVSLRGNTLFKIGKQNVNILQFISKYSFYIGH